MNLRTMNASDIPAGMRLKDLAGWNQTFADWQRFLESSPRGCFAAEVDGEVVGTAATIVYEQRFAWIGMVLVDPGFRSRGIGTRLLEKAIEYLDGVGVRTMKLDATPAGRPIYQKLGFADEYEIERWLLKRTVAEAAPAAGLHSISDRVLRLDREIFGADRGNHLHSLAAENPDFALAAERDEEIAGYTFGRRGALADHLGPWMARDEAAAAELLGEFLARSRRETVFVDALKDRRFVSRMLLARGFKVSRPLTRMVRGLNSYPGRPDLLCAILGPEFG
ncbi:MAG: GNAT family N-acetyltransferase [Acidobacteria bacterium]|nr:MAG: GNAT family N-acetyltransferase [Acidobacteriota bacterium]